MLHKGRKPRGCEYFFFLWPLIFVALSEAPASCHLSGAQNFDVALRYLENLDTLDKRIYYFVCVTYWHIAIVSARLRCKSFNYTKIY